MKSVDSKQIEQQAQQIWDTMDDNERHGVKFGMFPANKMPKEHVEGLAVALMAIASKPK